MSETRHVSTRCARMAEHRQLREVMEDGQPTHRYEPVLAEPCPECFSIESRRIPWEPPGVWPVQEADDDH